MKRFTKISLGIASTFAVFGVICLIISFAMGLTLETFTDMVQDGKFRFHLVRMEKSQTSKQIDEEIQKLNIEYDAGVLEIYYDDVEQIEIEENNVPDFESTIKKGTLYVEGGKGIDNNSNATLVIILPKDMRFQNVDLELGASQTDITGLMADTVNIEVGAGEVTLMNLDTKNLNAETGIGQLSVELVGEESEYSYNLECGIGSVEIGNRSFGGLGTTKNIVNSGSNRMVDVECGIGEVQIDFTKNL